MRHRRFVKFLVVVIVVVVVRICSQPSQRAIPEGYNVMVKDNGLTDCTSTFRCHSHGQPTTAFSSQSNNFPSCQLSQLPPIQLSILFTVKVTPNIKTNRKVCQHHQSSTGRHLRYVYVAAESGGKVFNRAGFFFLSCVQCALLPSLHTCSFGLTVSIDFLLFLTFYFDLSIWLSFFHVS